MKRADTVEFLCEVSPEESVFPAGGLGGSGGTDKTSAAGKHMDQNAEAQVRFQEDGDYFWKQEWRDVTPA